MWPEWYSSQCATIQGAMTASWPTTAFEVKPVSMDAPIPTISRCTASASHPWSNSWPSGEEEPVRRACLPSRTSRCRYANVAAAMRPYTQLGATASRAGA